MQYEITIAGGDELVTVRNAGPATLADLQHMVLAVMQHADFRPGMNILVDNRAFDPADLTPEQIAEVAQMVRGAREQLGGGRCAVVAARAVDFGLARMWELMTEDGVDFQIGIFRSVAEAKGWLTDGTQPG